MIQLHIPWEGDGGYEQHLEKNTGSDFKQK
jgi:hypothetical protein